MNAKDKHLQKMVVKMKMMMIIMAKIAIMVMRLKLTVKMVCGGESKGINIIFIPVCPALKVMLHRTIRNDDFQCNTHPTFE